MFTRAFLAVGLCTWLACGPEEKNSVRGRGLERAPLTGAEQAGVYAATVRAAFDLGPSLNLLIHPHLLPSSRGYEGGEATPPAVKRVMLDSGIVQGDCRPERSVERRSPVCDATSPGYVVQLSNIFRVPGDSLQVYLMAERYRLRTMGATAPFRFETAFQLIRRGNRWTVVRKARLRTT